MVTFTKNYSALGGPLTFNVLTDFVDKNGVNTTVTAEIGSAYVLTDNFIITGTTGFNDTIITAADTITDTGGTSTTIDGGAKSTRWWCREAR